MFAVQLQSDWVIGIVVNLSQHLGFVLNSHGSSSSSSSAILRYLDVAKCFEFHFEMDFLLSIRFQAFRMGLHFIHSS